MDDAWVLQNALGQEVGRAELVVLANAMGCAKLLSKGMPTLALPASLQDKLAHLQALHGMLSHGVYAEDLPHLPAIPRNGHGFHIAHLPQAQGEGWLLGATYEADAIKAADLWAQHASNLARLEVLLPETGAALAQHLQRAPVKFWSATRCVTQDRLPLVGPVDAAAAPGLWLCVGMGSRGLSLAPLCAQLLAARLGAEPWPLEFSLARSLDAHRQRRHPAKASAAQALAPGHSF
jgi:tRNA 5-methylaminomethyl-2-thiouridine biosynthesis bifunctional protein